MSKRSKIFILVFSILISVLIFVFREKLFFFQNWGYLGIFLLNLVSSASIIVPVIPGVISTLIGGSVFNPVLVGLVAAAGASIGEMTSYFVGLGGGELLKEDKRSLAGFAGKRIKKIEGWMKKRGMWVIFFLAAVPNPFFDIAGFIAGASEIPINKFLLAVFCGKVIRFTAIALIGYGFF